VSKGLAPALLAATARVHGSWTDLDDKGQRSPEPELLCVGGHQLLMNLYKYSGRIASLITASAIVALAFVTLGVSQAFAQGPSSVPAFRAYGTVSGGSGSSGGTVNAVSVSAPGTTCGTGTVSANGSYFVDIQSIAGCSGNVTFTVNGQPTTNPPTSPPSTQGSPVQVNLTVGQATPTPAPPPPPSAVATPPPPPPPPPPAATAVVPAAPPNTGVGPGPVRVAPQAAPQLPNTGTGGLLQSDSQSGIAPWLVVGLAVALVTLLTSARIAYRRTR